VGCADNKRSIFLQHPRRPASPSASLGDDEYASPFASSLKLSPWPRVGQQDDNRLACQLQVSCLCVLSLECLSDKKKHTARVSAPSLHLEFEDLLELSLHQTVHSYSWFHLKASTDAEEKVLNQNHFADHNKLLIDSAVIEIY
jgi:hypothetical protein